MASMTQTKMCNPGISDFVHHWLLFIFEEAFQELRTEVGDSINNIHNQSISVHHQFPDVRQMPDMLRNQFTHLDDEEGEDNEDLFLVLLPPSNSQPGCLDSDPDQELTKKEGGECWRHEPLRGLALESEIQTLHECVEVCEAMVDDLKQELAKEQSRSELLRLELKLQEENWRSRLQQAELSNSEKDSDLLRSHLEQQRLHYTKTIQALKADLEDKVAQLKESEDSKRMLRNEMERCTTDMRLQQDQLREQLSRSNEEVLSLRQRLANKDKGTYQLQRRTQILAKELAKSEATVNTLNSSLQQFRVIDERSFRFAQILKHIDNID